MKTQKELENKSKRKILVTPNTRVLSVDITGMRSRVKRNREEESHQRAFIKWASMHKYKSGVLRHYLLHIPNESKRTPGFGKLLVDMGMTAGAWDIFCFIPNNKYPGLWLEFKSKTGRLTPHQKTFQSRLEECGQLGFVVRSWLEAKEIILNYIDNVEMAKVSEAIDDGA